MLKIYLFNKSTYFHNGRGIYLRSHSSPLFPIQDVARRRINVCSWTKEVWSHTFFRTPYLIADVEINTKTDADMD